MSHAGWSPRARSLRNRSSFGFNYDVQTALESFGDNFVVDKLDITDASDVNKVDEWTTS